jgi:hypothetical protein
MTNIIKQLSMLGLASCLTLTTFAQGQKTVTFDVAGLKVILRPTPKDVISARLFVKGGANYAKDKEGMKPWHLA